MPGDGVAPTNSSNMEPLGFVSVTYKTFNIPPLNLMLYMTGDKAYFS